MISLNDSYKDAPSPDAQTKTSAPHFQMLIHLVRVPVLRVTIRIAGTVHRLVTADRRLLPELVRVLHYRYRGRHTRRRRDGYGRCR